MACGTKDTEWIIRDASSIRDDDDHYEEVCWDLFYFSDREELHDHIDDLMLNFLLIVWIIESCYRKGYMGKYLGNVAESRQELVEK